MSGMVHTKAPKPTSSFAPPSSKFSNCNLTRCCTHGEPVNLHKKSLALQPPLVQAKLTISQPNDKYEQEADRIADLVMSKQEPRMQGKEYQKGEIEETQLQAKLIFSQITPLIQRQAEVENIEGEDEILQRKHTESQTCQAGNDPKGQLKSLNGCGNPLPGSVRNFFERKFDHDFGDVRVHTNPDAAKSAQLLNAKAFAIGNNILFGAGRYSPRTFEGMHLLAHELTHIIQQGRSSLSRKLLIQRSPIAIYASGWRNLMPCVRDPDSKDFEATAKGCSTRYYPASNASDLYGVITKEKGIDDISLIGHGANGIFDFNSRYNNSLDKESLQQLLIPENEKMLKKMRSNIKRNAKLTYYSCNTGADQNFLNLTKQVFGTKAFGFKKTVEWNISCIDNVRDETTQGQVRYQGQSWQSNAKNLNPDANSA